MNLQDPSPRMSTTYGSEQGTVYILDEAEVGRGRRSAARSPTPAPRCGAAPDKAGITNLIEILSVVRGVAPEEIEREFEGSGYGDFKGAVAEAVVEYLAPGARALRGASRPTRRAIETTLAAGAEKARAIASGTLADVRDAMGIGPPARA